MPFIFLVVELLLASFGKKKCCELAEKLTNISDLHLMKSEDLESALIREGVSSGDVQVIKQRHEQFMVSCIHPTLLDEHSQINICMYSTIE